MKHGARDDRVHMDQVGLISPFQPCHTPSGVDERIHVTIGQRPPKWESVYGNALILCFVRQLEVVLGCHYEELVAALTQGRKQLGCEDLSASYVWPEQFRPV
jgi:hypothetical protein